MTVVTRTERLLVRKWTEEPTDVARFYDIYSRPEVVRWFGGARDLPLTDPEQALDRVRGWQGSYSPDGRYGLWAVELRAGDRDAPAEAGPPGGGQGGVGGGLVVGTALVKPLRGRDMEPVDQIEVGWHLHPDSWGNGYATEAARALVAREFAAGTRRVHAVVLPGNEPSMAVARRLGMTHVGRRADWYGGLEMETFVLSA
ncbi:GNAT family N-acetyltransferase [Micromonospora sp. WMMD882]|uniref:GNAT family N-acetyltransferase n=1 Tax=Micromonospora sp. WMMD882 TaxID=3015151 RepID=UPI00248D2C3C|nr:GNAT family N-acetyltransferase [Micromonospora sp. WMMD882]WBB81916.1 GNAT family N-acetyltransferase [Micromonospora sp. WMMD882]